MNNKWTIASVPSMEGKVAIVSGANSGIGLETTKALLSKGCEVVMACRNLKKSEPVQQELQESFPESKLHLLRLDLGDLKSVSEFVADYAKKFRKIDLLVNNAGVMSMPKGKTKDGFETHFGINHLGHFALNAQLFPMIKDVEGARIVTVSSMAHRVGKVRFDDIHWEKKYNKMQAYGMSKLANLLFHYELDVRLKNAGLKASSYASHPGYTSTELLKKGPEAEGADWKMPILNIANRYVAQSSEMGALPSIYAACAKDAEAGKYYGPGGWLEIKGWPKEVPSAAKAKEESSRLWALSEELCGVKFEVA